MGYLYPFGEGLLFYKKSLLISLFPRGGTLPLFGNSAPDFGTPLKIRANSRPDGAGGRGVMISERLGEIL